MAVADGPDYLLELRLFRHVWDEPTLPKTLFLDFDGAVVDPAIFGQTPGSVTLSPFSSFLSR